MKTTRLFLVVLSIAVLTIASCQKDLFNFGKGSDVIGFNVNGVVASLATKTAEGDVMLLKPCEGGSGVPYLYVIKTPYDPQGPAVRGTIVTSDNIGTAYGKFTVNAIEAGKTEKYMDNIDVNYEDGKWVIDGKGETYRWIDGVDLSFWAYAPGYTSDSFSITQVGEESMSFDYSFEDLSATTPYTKDLILAYAKQSSGEVHLDFHHALAALAAFVDAEQDPLVKILDCKFDGIYTKGSCVYTPSGISWTGEGEKGGYKAPLAGGSALSQDNPHFAIPQSLESGSVITITVDNCGSEETLSYSLAGTAWDAGYRYIYRLSYNPPVFDAYLTDGESFNAAIKGLTSETIEHVVFVKESDVTTGTEVQKAGTRGKVYANYDSATKTVTVSTPCTNLYANERCVRMFNELNDLVSIDMSSVNTSLVESMAYMFRYCEKLTDLNMSGWDTSNVESMSNMFAYAYKLANINFPAGWNTSNVTNMNGMFAFCESLATLDLSKFNTSEVEDMGSMFYGTGLDSLDVSKFDTRKVKTMYAMFYYSASLKSLDVSNFVTDKVENMAGMFGGCLALDDLKGVENFDTSKVTQMTQMFVGCKVKKLDLSKFDTSKVEELTHLFYECEDLEELNLSGWVTSEAKSMHSLFFRCRSLSTLDLSSFDTRNVEHFQWFLAESGVKNLTLGKDFVFSKAILDAHDAAIVEPDTDPDPDIDPIITDRHVDEPFFNFIDPGTSSYSIWCPTQTYLDIRDSILVKYGKVFNWTWENEDVTP